MAHAPKFRITGSYTLDYNILSDDMKIRQELENQKHTLVPHLRQKVNALLIASQKPQTQIDYRACMNKIAKHRARIQLIEQEVALRAYVRDVDPVLQRYRELASVTRQVSSSTIFTDTEDAALDDIGQQRLAVIDDFFQLAKNYVVVDVQRVYHEPKLTCMGCHKVLEDVYIDDDGVQRCTNPRCGVDNRGACYIIDAKDAALAARTDDSLDNLLRAFERFQGKQPDKIPAIVYAKLDAYFAARGKPTGAEVKLMELKPDGVRGNTSLLKLKDALKNPSVGYSAFNEDMALIARNYWGWVLPDLDDKKSALVRNYQKTQKAQWAIPVEQRGGRTSSISTQYRLWRELQLLGVMYDVNRFSIPEDLKSITNHHQLWRRMVDGANDPEHIFHVDDNSGQWIEEMLGEGGDER